jgi:hypothetical protein
MNAPRTFPIPEAAREYIAARNRSHGTAPTHARALVWNGYDEAAEGCAVNGRSEITMLRTGDASAAQLCEAMMRKVDDLALAPSSAWHTRPDVSGGFPIVAAHLAGHPAAMRRRTRTTTEAPPLVMIADCTTSGAVSNRQMADRGAIMLAADTLDQDIERVRMELEEHGCGLHHDGGSGYHIVSSPTHNKTARPVMITNVLTGNHNKYGSVGEAFNYIKDILKISKSGFQARCKKESTFDGLSCKYLPLENRWQNKIKEILYNLGLKNMHSYDKFIPDCYKFSSIEDRTNLLRGLMDTDGTIKKNGEASFCTTSKRLAGDITDIVRSLGGRAIIRQRDRRNKSPSVILGRKINKNLISYEFNISLPEEINPFYAKRKALHHRCSYIYDARIKSIEFVGEKEAKCILIDNPEHLYITDDFIVTHNTKLEKLQPWIQPIFDNLKHMMKCSDMYLNLLIEKGKIEVESLSYIRGRTFPNTIMIIDEAQNSTPSEMKAVITRMGEKSKLIITGDLEQIDSPKLDIYSSGLSTVVNKFKQSELSAHITLMKTERSELAALAAKLL